MAKKEAIGLGALVLVGGGLYLLSKRAGAADIEPPLNGEQPPGDIPPNGGNGEAVPGDVAPQGSGYPAIFHPGDLPSSEAMIGAYGPAWVLTQAEWLAAGFTGSRYDGTYDQWKQAFELAHPLQSFESFVILNIGFDPPADWWIYWGREELAAGPGDDEPTAPSFPDPSPEPDAAPGLGLTSGLVWEYGPAWVMMQSEWYAAGFTGSRYDGTYAQWAYAWNLSHPNQGFEGYVILNLGFDPPIDWWTFWGRYDADGAPAEIGDDAPEPASTGVSDQELFRLLQVVKDFEERIDLYPADAIDWLGYERAKQDYQDALASRQ